MTAIKIELSMPEVVWAAQAGLMRQAQNIKARRKHAHNLEKLAELKKKDSWAMHIQGCLAEFAIAKVMGFNYSGVFEFRGMDVGQLQVRTTEHDHGRLILHDTDADDHLFVLVTGKDGKYVIHGCMRAKDGKRKEWKDDPQGGREAYFVPQKELIPINEARTIYGRSKNNSG